MCAVEVERLIRDALKSPEGDGCSFLSLKRQFTLSEDMAFCLLQRLESKGNERAAAILRQEV